MAIHELSVIDEGTTASLTCAVADSSGTAVPLSAMNSITMTVIEEKGGTTVNSRSAQDVKNANNCTYHATSGLFTFDLQPGDVAIENATDNPIGSIERHLITVTFVWDSSAESISKQFLLQLRNLKSVPQS